MTVYLPDAGKVLRRADQKWAKRTADDPADADYLAALALDVQQQIVEPLAGIRVAVVAPGVDDAEVRQLRTDNADLADQVEHLRRELAEYKAAPEPTPEPDPWGDLLGRVRNELVASGWPA